MIPKSTRNALANAGNQYQTNATRVLTVCSAGMLRSPSLANVLHQKYGFNTRACGTGDYALVPITEVLLTWAEVIVFVNYENFNAVKNDEIFQRLMKNRIVIISDIPDHFNWMNDELVTLLSSPDWDSIICGLEANDKEGEINYVKVTG